MVGALSVLEIREMAPERLGEEFELREFHGVVLQNGAMPLTLLERVVRTGSCAGGDAPAPRRSA